MPLSKSTKKGFSGGRDDSPEPGPSKRGDKYSSDEDEEPAPRKGKAVSKMSKQGKNKKTFSKQAGGTPSHQKPAELFRKDLISAMKLADTEILHESEYVVISDPWRQEWEKGVQVPVNEEEIHPVDIRIIKEKGKTGDFKMPPRKYFHEKIDDTYVAGQHELTGMQELAEQIVRYDLDDQDVTWLELVNEDREEMGLQEINEWNLERMIEELENQCYINTNALKKTEEGLGIEYDEDIACDVCRMLESEDTNEMVFCDGCDICVHQACYGIQTIPEGSWLCRICALGIKPMCLLCPKRGGAMKSTRSGTKWTHVSCALWIPEVSIGDPEKMEPITKISNIPPSRWALVCCLCKERVGACIQCSVKQCKTAFHVTCGFAHNLDMKTVLDDTDEIDGIHLRAYCPKHTKNRNASDSESPKKDGEEDIAEEENEENEAEMARQRVEKLQQLEEEFYKFVSVADIAQKFFIPEEAVDIVAEYWKLKRKVNHNKPLITPKMEEEDQMQKQQKDSLSARMKMFVHLRQDLERARNLCYMISKREKTKRQFFRLKESVFRAQIRVLTDPDLNLSAREAEQVRQDYNFDSMYSNYGVMTAAQSVKGPRENLFTLENLKTPKDFVESGEEAGGETSGRSSSASTKISALKDSENGKKSKEKTEGSSADSASLSGKSESGRKNLFSMDSFSMINDSSADSSDEEAGVEPSRTYSTQMSRLGKVKPEELEEKAESVKSEEDSRQKAKKFMPPSDLKKKLTSILQSKTMLQQRNEKQRTVGQDTASEEIHVNVVNSDSEVFTSDTNTDMFSPPGDQQRNLFDQFQIKAKPILSSPDLPRQEPLGISLSLSGYKSHKKKKRKHSRSPHKHKRSRQLLSPSDQSSISSLSIKLEVPSSSAADDDSFSVGQNSQIFSDDDRLSLASPVIPTDTSDGTRHHRHHRHRSLSKEKKRSRKDKGERSSRGSSSSPDKALRSKQSLLSPSPRVHPQDAYATVDGDIYVPSGKIQVTETTIVLGSPKEEKHRVRSKLRLKKQSNSPVKGVVSYEVVKDDDEDPMEVDSKINKNEESNLFDQMTNSSETQTAVSKENGEHEVSSSPVSHRALRKTKLVEETIVKSEVVDPNSEATDIVSSEVKQKIVSDDKEEEKDGIRKDLFGVGPRRGRRRKATKDIKTDDDDGGLGNSSDENRPASPIKLRSAEKMRPRRLHTARRLHTDETEGDEDSDDFVESPLPRKSRSSSRKSSVKLQPIPNRPDLSALMDSSKLIVKEPLKRQISARMGKLLQKRGRWNSSTTAMSKGQTTMDKFLKRTSSCENVFTKTDDSLLQKRLSLPLGRSDLHPLQTKSPSLNSSLNSDNPSSNSDPLSPSPLKTVERAIFGAKSSPKTSLTYCIPKKTGSEKKDDSQTDAVNGHAVFGDAEKLQRPGLKRSLSFEDVQGEAGLEQVMKTPSKCNVSEMGEDKLDGNRSYRSQSPASSEASGVEGPHHNQSNSRESTPSRRMTRSRLNEETPSPITRLRKREGLLKPPQLKLS